MVSYIHVLRLKLFTHFWCMPYVLQTTPISFFWFTHCQWSDICISDHSPRLSYLLKYHLLSKFVILPLGPTGCRVVTDLVFKAVYLHQQGRRLCLHGFEVKQTHFKVEATWNCGCFISVRHHACLKNKGNAKRLIGVLCFGSTLEGSKTFQTILIPE